MRIGDTSTATKPGAVLTEKGEEFAPAIAKNDRIELSFLAHALSSDDARNVIETYSNADDFKEP